MRHLALLALVLLPTGALALMPPHFDSTTPKDGAELKSPTIVLHGYSLGYGDVKVTTAEGAPVPFTQDTKCAWVGKGDMPGAQQQRCTITIALGAVKGGTTLTVRMMRSSATFEVPAAGFPAAPPSAPKSAP